MEDETLIREIKSGDTEALDTLISKYYKDVYTYCFRRLGNKQDAQDVTQDVFLHFCRSFDSYTQKGRCRNYLFVIARNLCLNAMRRQFPIPLEDVEKAGLSDGDPLTGRLETAGSLQAAMNRLPEEQKEAVLLRFCHDLKVREIARIMNSGLSVTKYRLYQGLKTLSKLLSKEDWI